MEQRSNEYKRYYSNSTGIEVTNVDISIDVNYIEREKEINLCRVTYSPEQAKITMLMLQEAINKYEKTNRKINVNMKPKVINKTEGEIINEEE